MATTHVVIADDATQANVDDIMTAAQAGHAVIAVHSICSSISGRRLLARRLKAAGCSPQVAANLGWATAEPSKPDEKPSTDDLTPVRSTDRNRDDSPRSRKRSRGKQTTVPVGGSPDHDERGES